jgi:DNA invertase Pin-like site-specific DNA recombinase
MRQYARKRQWKIILEINEVGSGAKTRPQREELLKAARRREVDVIIVWRLDRWGSLADLVTTLKELSEIGVGFVSLTEAIDLTTPSGRALAGMLAVFAEFERDILGERVKAGIAQAREKGKPHGRPRTAAKQTAEIKRLFKLGFSKSAISRQLKIGRTSVIRILNQEK